MKNERYIERMKACMKRAAEAESVEEQYFAAGFFESLMWSATEDPNIDAEMFESYLKLRGELFELLRRLHIELPMFIHYAITLEGEWNQ